MFLPLLPVAAKHHFVSVVDLNRNFPSLSHGQQKSSEFGDWYCCLLLTLAFLAAFNFNFCAQVPLLSPASKEIDLFSGKGVLFSNKKECTIDTVKAMNLKYIVPSKTSKTQNVRVMIPLV